MTSLRRHTHQHAAFQQPAFQQPAHRHAAQKRSGTILIAVLVCLAIASTITGAAIQSSLRARHQMKVHWQLEQTRTLLDAGIRRTLSLAAEDSNYEGESWVVDDALESFSEARVEIKPLPTDNLDETDVARFEVIATIRNRDLQPVQTKRSQIVVTQRTSSPAPSRPSDDNSSPNEPSDNS
ncbi:hypothetical protein [Rhodopirellula sp. SWK7]|uniref:hypothetical protein n=1 Tax=Rhodopirellula sp. SWK7 TaxID=595460 RepID=UPI001181A7DA|nr:hypothetical protein [Rhodopirellula sp. SWK7]